MELLAYLRLSEELMETEKTVDQKHKSQLNQQVCVFVLFSTITLLLYPLCCALYKNDKNI